MAQTNTGRKSLQETTDNDEEAADSVNTELENDYNHGVEHSEDQLKTIIKHSDAST